MPDTATALAAAQFITSAIGTGFEAFGQYEEAIAAAEAERFNAEASRYNAAISRQQAQMVAQSRKLETRRLRRFAQSFLSTQRATYAKAGVRFEGSPLEVVADTAAELEMDILVTQYNADIERFGLESQARMQELEAQQAESREAGFRSRAVTRPVATILTRQADNLVRLFPTGGDRTPGGGGGTNGGGG